MRKSLSLWARIGYVERVMRMVRVWVCLAWGLLAVLAAGCADPCADRAAVGYPDADCPSGGGGGGDGGGDSGGGGFTPDECLGIGFVREGVLTQLCLECGAVLCQYRAVSRTPLGGLEVEIVGELPVDPDWVEYHDGFTDAEGGSGIHRKEMVLPVTDDADAWSPNVNTMFNFSLPEVQAEVSMEISVMLPDGTYPECIIYGNRPDRFTDACEERPLP